ncbi:hypothetical protein [Streptomyces sp. NBC_00083]|uniref:hypothetical protein n=1 Tax=Streptomyces sp. NBC_00083 TaxID=2975647 RepID=UPI002253F8FE|nr:hypothetical protein [Streptomyces sp. NBC_00083]MCX5387500.1 hypothetical protein [Streptomyces sp. NBC_00083]
MAEVGRHVTAAVVTAAKSGLFIRTTLARERLSSVISEANEPRRELFLRNDLEAVDVVSAHREALRVLRDSIETAHVDAYSDVPWPRDVVDAYEHALSMAKSQSAEGVRSAKDDPGMGIDVAVRDDAEFDVLLALAPFTIHAEAWRQGQEIFSASDTGTALWIAVTSQQEVQLMSRLGALGVPRTAFTTQPRRRRRLFARWSRHQIA